MIFNHYHGKNVHLGITGSIAAYKSLDLMRLCLKSNLNLSVTLTSAGEKFVPSLNYKGLGAKFVFTEQDFFAQDFPHLYPQKQADVFLICPCTANTLAKISLGLADNLLTTQALAFDGPILLAPAMNVKMWENPLTQKHLNNLKSQPNLTLINPGQGQLACGDTGKGRLAEIETIYLYLLKTISEQDLKGKKVLITAGPTREFFDPVRFWSNPSSGYTGICLASAAWIRGAKVYLVLGPTSVKVPDLPGLQVFHVTSAIEMHATCQKLWPEMDVGICSAAVCDFRPEQSLPTKFKKENQDVFSVPFVSNPDVLAHLGQSKKASQKLVGFALESENFIQEAKRKLKAKNLDLILANQVQTKPFGQEENQLVILDKYGRLEKWPELPKTEIAWRIWDILLSL